MRLQPLPYLPELHHGNQDEYCVVRVPKRCIPKGAVLVEAYLTEREVIVMGDPPDEDELTEDGHNCDAMGCGSVGSHVLYRFKLPTKERQ